MGRRAVPAIGAMLCAASFAGGCGGDEESEPTPIRIEATQPAEGRQEFVAPESVDAGVVEIRFTNSSKVPREAQLIRLDDDHTLKQALETIAGGEEGSPIPDWLHAEGGIGQTAPGASATATVVLDEGSYHLIDTGNEGDGEGPSNFEQGAQATIEVSEGDDDAELPQPDATIEMNEYSFVTSGLKAGDNTFVLKNTGKELHHTIAAPIAEGATLADVRKFLQSEGGAQSGPPPLDFEKVVGTAVLDGGRDQIAELELQAGRYALLCFLTDRKGGPPHIAKGMIREIEVS
jgi:hypothetical protein